MMVLAEVRAGENPITCASPKNPTNNMQKAIGTPITSRTKKASRPIILTGSIPEYPLEHKTNPRQLI